jgi:hypothetical protein
MKTEFAPTKLRPPTRSVRITMPASVAYDPKRLKAGIAELAELLGCPKCFSGADCLLQMERNFVLDPGPAGARAVAASDPMPWGSAELNVDLAQSVKYDLDKLLRAVDKVIDLIGPHPCISGYDVLLRDRLNTVIVNEKLETQVLDAGF